MTKGKNSIEKLMKMATLASVSVASIIIAIKVVAWVMTDSLSLLSSLADSVLDVASSLVSLVAVSYSLQPADEDHRFGHGKAEDIAAFAQGTFIAGSGVFIVIEAIGRFVNPREVTNEMVGIWVMVASTVLTLGLLAFQKYVVAETKSTAIKADSVHYHTDLLVNGLVMLTFVVSIFWHIGFLDPLLALVIAGYIFKSAYHVGREAFDKLMDREFSDDERQRIMEVILRNKNVKGIHDLRTRSSGIKPFIQFHLEMDGSLTLQDAHIISDEIEADLLSHFPNAEVLIHQDPMEIVNVSPQSGRVVPVDKR